MYAKKYNFNEWLAQLNINVHKESDIRELKTKLMSHFSKEIKWLTELPTAIETEDYIFVHAGLEDRERLERDRTKNAIAMPEFFNHKSK